MLDRAYGFDTKNCRYMGNFENLGNTCDSKNFSNTVDRISSNTNNSNNLGYSRRGLEAERLSLSK